jgi:hypothetical protein
VNRLITHKKDKNTDDNFRQYRQYFWAMRKELNRASKMLADGDLETFLLCTDKSSQKKKTRLATLILKLGIELKDHLNHFYHSLPFDITEEE